MTLLYKYSAPKLYSQSEQYLEEDCPYNILSKGQNTWGKTYVYSNLLNIEGPQAKTK